MTPEQLKEALTSGTPYTAVVSLGDRFVASTLTSPEEFWRGDDVRREFYSLLALLHHANSNGLESVIDYNEELWIPIIAFASKLLRQIKAGELTASIVRFEEIIASHFKLADGELPRSAAALRELQGAVATMGLEWTASEAEELAGLNQVFIGCANGELPLKIHAWVMKNAEDVASLIG